MKHHLQLLILLLTPATLSVAMELPTSPSISNESLHTRDGAFATMQENSRVITPIDERPATPEGHPTKLPFTHENVTCFFRKDAVYDSHMATLHALKVRELEIENSFDQVNEALSGYSSKSRLMLSPFVPNTLFCALPEGTVAKFNIQRDRLSSAWHDIVVDNYTDKDACEYFETRYHEILTTLKKLQLHCKIGWYCARQQGIDIGNEELRTEFNDRELTPTLRSLALETPEEYTTDGRASGHTIIQTPK